MDQLRNSNGERIAFLSRTERGLLCVCRSSGIVEIWDYVNNLRLCRIQTVFSHNYGRGVSISKTSDQIVVGSWKNGAEVYDFHGTQLFKTGLIQEVYDIEFDNFNSEILYYNSPKGFFKFTVNDSKIVKLFGQVSGFKQDSAQSAIIACEKLKGLVSLHKHSDLLNNLAKIESLGMQDLESTVNLIAISCNGFYMHFRSFIQFFDNKWLKLTKIESDTDTGGFRDLLWNENENVIFTVFSTNSQEGEYLRKYDVSSQQLITEISIGSNDFSRFDKSLMELITMDGRVYDLKSMTLSRILGFHL